MRLENLRRWHWMLIGLVAGLLVGQVYYMTDGDSAVGDPKNNFIDPREFERDLVSTWSPKGQPEVKRPTFEQLRVIRLSKPLQGGELYAVRGIRWQQTRDKDGNVALKGNDRWFPAPHPYKPKAVIPAKDVKVPESGGWMAGMQSLAEKLGLKEPDPPGSVLEYLAKVQADKKINGDGRIKFEYRWWESPRVTRVTWTVGGFVVIGLVWPTIVNLVAFGSPFRPREKKEPKPARVKSKPEPEKKKPTVTAEDMEQLKKLEEELEAKLKEGARSRADLPSPAPAEEPAAPVRQLTAAPPVEPIVVPKEDVKHEYKMREDDLYPVERGPRKKD